MSSRFIARISLTVQRSVFNALKNHPNIIELKAPCMVMVVRNAMVTAHSPFLTGVILALDCLDFPGIDATCDNTSIPRYAMEREVRGTKRDSGIGNEKFM